MENHLKSYNERAAKFQMGHNSMQENSLEKHLVIKEKLDREMAHIKYVMGIQGKDGGKCY